MDSPVPNDSAHAAVVRGRCARSAPSRPSHSVRKGDLSRVAELYGSSRWTIAGLWKDYQHQKATGAVCPDLHKRRGNCCKCGTLPNFTFRMCVQFHCGTSNHFLYTYLCSGIRGCVCVFFPFILDFKFVGRTSRGPVDPGRLSPINIIVTLGL